MAEGCLWAGEAGGGGSMISRLLGLAADWMVGSLLRWGHSGEWGGGSRLRKVLS